MDTQDENKLQEFDQEVDSVVRKSKRKLSDGRKKRSKTSDESAIAEESPVVN